MSLFRRRKQQPWVIKINDEPVASSSLTFTPSPITVEPTRWQPRLDVYRTTDGWRWTLYAGNHRIVAASSEAFSAERKARENFRRTIEIGTEVLS